MPKKDRLNCQVPGTSVSVQLAAMPDTGAEVTLMSESTFRSLRIGQNHLKQLEIKIVNAENCPMTQQGTFSCIFQYGNRKCRPNVYVGPKEDGLLLDWLACRELAIIPPDFPVQIATATTHVNGRMPNGRIYWRNRRHIRKRLPGDDQERPRSPNENTVHEFDTKDSPSAGHRDLIRRGNRKRRPPDRWTYHRSQRGNWCILVHVCMATLWQTLTSLRVNDL